MTKQKLLDNFCFFFCSYFRSWLFLFNNWLFTNKIFQFVWTSANATKYRLPQFNFTN